MSNEQENFKNVAMLTGYQYHKEVLFSGTCPYQKDIFFEDFRYGIR